MAITLPITTRTSSDDNDFADVYGNDAQLVTEINERDSVYRSLLQAGGLYPGGVSASTRWLGSKLGAEPNMLDTSVALSTASGQHGILPSIIYLDDADYAVSSKSLRLRVRAYALTNATAPAVTFTFGLYPITVAGVASVLSITPGTVTSGSAVALASPSASSVTQGNSGDFTFPSDGAYMLAVATNGTAAANSTTGCVATLQVRHV